MRFGTFEIDVAADELRKNGIKLKLQEQPFQVLCMLLEHPGEVVTRKNFAADSGQGTPSAISITALTAVKRLRDALGDDPDNPRFVETVPRRGYRFVSSSDLAADSGATARATKWHSRKWRVIVVGTVLCILVVIAISLHFTRLPIVQMTQSPLVTYPGEKFYPSLSPNGQRLVFSWNGGSGADFSLYETVVGSERFLRLTNVPGAIDFDPVWSPDEREIAFARIANGVAGIYIISALGGAERKLLQTVWSSTTSIDPFTPGRLDWSPDGKLIAYSDNQPDGKPVALFLLSLDSMQTYRLSSPPFQTGDVDPKFSPDGQTIAFVRDTTGGQSIYLVPVSGGEERLVPSDFGLKRGLAWMGDGRNLVYGGRWLWRVPIAGGPPERLRFGQDGYQPSIRGNRMAYTQASLSDSIWRRHLDSQGGREAAQRLISSTRIDAGPQFSPDGRTIAFQSDRSGVFEIWLCKSDGTDVRQLTHFGVAWTGTPRWSPDGRFIVFDSRPKGDADIFVADVQGGLPQRITIDPSNEVVPSWSRDGRWIYFASDRSGRWEVWKAPSAGGTANQITHQGGFAALESADGKTLYYAKSLNLPGIWKVSPAGGEESEVVGMPQPGFWGYWAPVRDGIYYLDTSRTPGFDFLSLSTHRTNRVFDLEDRPVEGAPGLAVSPNGKFILYTLLNQSNSDIALVQNLK